MTNIEECKAQLAKWDAGDLVWTVEMGGMGPGYEQAIQITAFEILRHLVSAAPDHSNWDDEAEWAKARDVIDKAVGPVVNGIGLSGAQWGAAMGLATRFYMKGPKAARKEVDDDRSIMVSKNFPSLEKIKEPT